MFLFKKIVTVISAILGAAIGLLFVALINWAFALSMSFSHVFLYGVLGGAVTGIFAAYLITIYLVRKAKRFVQQKLLNLHGRFSSMRSI